jgi:hypothetical protein
LLRRGRDASRALFDAALVGWGLGKLPWAGEKKLGLMDLMHEPIVEGILGVIGRSVPGIDSAARPWRYPLHGSAAGIGQLMTHLRVVESVREIYLLQGDYEGYAAQATNNGLAVRVLGRDEAMGISGAVWFISNPSAIDGEPLGDTWVAELCEHNRVVVDVAYHGLCGQRSVVVPESAWAVLWSLSKPWGLFWRRVGILAACVEIPCAYGTRWYKDPQALMGAWAVVAKYEPWAMAERYRWAQNEAVALLAGVGVRTRAASTLLLARVHQTDVDEAVWEQLGRAERVNGSGVARVCLSPLIEALIAREHGLRG